IMFYPPMLRQHITLIPYTTLFRSDKVVQAEQRVDCASGCNLNRPGMFLVMRKDQLLAGVQPTTDRFQLGPNQFDFLAIPPQSVRSEEHTSELQSLRHPVCRLLLEN